MNYKSVLSLLFGCFFLLFITGTVYGSKPPYNLEKIPLKGMVTMIDLGAKSCIPCKMMAPILEKLEKVYDGKAAIVFIDVWKHRRQAKRFRIRAIPTQIFFDQQGKEVYRHVGFMSEKAIVNQLKKMGVVLNHNN